jgi:hypothetical protein
MALQLFVVTGSREPGGRGGFSDAAEHFKRLQECSPIFWCSLLRHLSNQLILAGLKDSHTLGIPLRNRR